MKEISDELYEQLDFLGIIPSDTRNHNVGKSNYSKNIIQPWTIWLAYPELTSWDDDIIKRILRTKEESDMSANEARKMDYEKIIHICQERIRQIDAKGRYKNKSKNYPRQVLCIKTFYLDNGDELIELFTNNFFYNQPNKNIVIDNRGVRLYIEQDEFNKHFKYTD